jgi:hypothetical protein
MGQGWITLLSIVLRVFVYENLAVLGEYTPETMFLS